MKRKSFLQELEDYIPPSIVPDRLDTQARHCFSAVKKLFKQIDENCTEEESTDLKKRFINSLKGDMDYRKFYRGIDTLRKKDDTDAIQHED